MQVIFSPKHRQHAPPAEFVSSGLGPYSESPTRADSILAALESSGRFDISEPMAHADAALEAVHDAAYLDFLQRVYAVWSTPTAPGGNGIIPLTFAVRGLDTCPADLVSRAGYYCFDAQTPIVRGTFAAARAAVDAALTGADRLLAGDAAAYALCRPPGHHAAAAMYGGYCYLNNAAVAAAYLLERGRSPVAVLDIDYHHGNGTQEIFYHTDQVLTLSIHADPNRAYPHYLGYAGETGTNSGKGANFNLPLPPHVVDEDYLPILADALAEIAHRAGTYILVDGYQGPGQVPVDLGASEVDFYTTGPLKWLCGGPGLSYLYVREELIHKLQPRITSWFAAKDQFDFNLEHFVRHDDARRFELGTPALPTIHTALGGQEIIDEIGIDAIYERNRMLTAHVVTRALESGFELTTAPDPDDRSAIVGVIGLGYVGISEERKRKIRIDISLQLDDDENDLFIERIGKAFGFRRSYRNY